MSRTIRHASRFGIALVLALISINHAAAENVKIGIPSLTVTMMRCFTPGAYVVPPASIVKLPPPAFSPAPVWQPDSAQVDSPGTPDLPGSGPAACA